MDTCRLCHSDDLKPLINLGRLPIAHRMLKARNEPEETFPFDVSVCLTCGLPQITRPIDPEILYRSFNFNFSSWKFEPHQADELDTIHAFVRPRSVFEIGCNDGQFMAKLRDHGAQILVGVEPNVVSGKTARARGFTVYGDMVSSAICEDAVAKYGKFDLVVSRQVLEHVLDFENFFGSVHTVLADGGYLFIDVPDFAPSRIVGDVSSLWEEHVSYFTEETLRALLARHGFEPVSLRKYNFSGGGLAVCARRSHTDLAVSTDRHGIAHEADRFAQLVREFGRRLSAALERMRSKGAEISIYGAGCRACTFTNTHKLGSLVDLSIDDQKERQGLFMPGSRIPIHSPDVLTGRDSPLVCLLAVNNENEATVSARLRQKLKRPIHFASIFAPADIWGDLAKLEAL